MPPRLIMSPLRNTISLVEYVFHKGYTIIDLMLDEALASLYMHSLRA